MSDGREVAREPVVVRMILMSAPLWPCVCLCVCLRDFNLGVVVPSKGRSSMCVLIERGLCLLRVCECSNTLTYVHTCS